MDVVDALSMWNSQSLQLTLANVISSFLTFAVIFLSLLLLHDALVRNKQLNGSWLSAAMWSPSARQHPASPPGPWWNLPLVGYLPWLGRKPYVTLCNLSRRYGSVYQIRFGSRKVVVLNGREAIRAAFVQQGDTFAGRPDFPSFAVFCEGDSLGFGTVNAQWIVQRKVYMHVMAVARAEPSCPAMLLCMSSHVYDRA